jgi:quercetin dioxygenase-like cupin family protein
MSEHDLKLSHWDVQSEGALTEAAMRTKLEGLGYHVSRYVYPPGTVFPDHAHQEDKIDGVLSGEFEMQMAGQTVVLTAGDMLAVPRGIIHSAKVVGNRPVVSLDAIK